MTTKDEALKLALEALESVKHKIDSYQVNVCDDVDEAITAIRVALASKSEALMSVPDGAEQEAQQEPVATVTSESGNPNVSLSWWHEPALPVGTKLYTSPPASKPLPDEQIDLIVATSCKKDSSHLDAARVARAIEAAHGIKENNTR